MKKLFVIFAVLISMLISVCPVNAVKNEAIFELKSLGIMQGDENGDMHTDSDITRAEFAAVTVRMLGYADIANAASTVFKDVDETNIFSGSIALISDLGYVSGDGNGYFMPDDNIKLADCLKIMVDVLGYGLAAEKSGGYPEGYINIANKLSLTKNIDGNIYNTAKRGDAATVVYNALYVELLEPEYTTGAQQLTKNGERLIDRLLNNNDVYYTYGIVTADYDTFLIKPSSDIKSDEIEIDGERFTIDNINTKEIIGRSIEAYYKEAPSGKKVILNIALSTKNKITEVDADDLSNLTNTSLVYSNSNKKRTTLNTRGASYIYNGRLLTDYSIGELGSYTGKFVCVDNDGDNVCEYIFINEYESTVVEKVNENGCIFVKNRLPVYGRDYIGIEDDEEFHYSITDPDGVHVNLSDIKNGDVLSVYQSYDEKILHITVSSRTIEGCIESIDSEGTVIIDGAAYDQTKNINAEELIIGDNVKAYINEFDEIVFLEEIENNNSRYGYLIATETKGLSKHKVKIIVGSLVQNGVEIDETSEDKDEIPVLLCSNSEVLVLDAADKVKLNNTRVTSSKLISCLSEPAAVKFSLSAAGELNKIEVLDLEYGSKTVKMDYNAKDRTFGGISGILPFGVNSETMVVCVPTNEGASDEDLLSQIKIDNRDASVRYLASGYERDEDTKCVKLLVIKSELLSDKSLNITKNSNIGVVSKCRNELDQDGNWIKTVTVLSGDKETKLEAIDVQGDNGDTDNLKNGDLIIYALNNEGELVNSLIIKSLSGNILRTVSNKSKVNGCISGIVTNIKRLEINNENNKRVHILTVQTDYSSYEVEIPVRNIPNFYIYDKRSKTVKSGSFDDIKYGDLIAIAMPEEIVKDCVIVWGDN